MNEPRFPVRKKNRLANFDYSSQGLYFITICTQNKACILSEIENVGDGFPVPNLTDIGQYTKKYIELINEKYPNVFIDKYVIMPNHIHLLMYLGEKNDNIKGTSPPTTGNVIGWLKYTITKQVNIGQNKEKRKFFQRSYYDHIVRNEKSYKIISEYIEKNPLVWDKDCFFTPDKK